MSQRVTSLLQKCRFNNRVRMILKVVITSTSTVAFHVDDKFCVENIHILANMNET